MAVNGKQKGADGPMTLHAIMQESVGMGLRERYKPEREIPHGMLVLLMQMKDDTVRAERAERQAMSAPR